MDEDISAKLHKCDFPGCSKVFPKLWRLKEHVCSAHGGERSFVCSHPGCGKSFIRAFHLKRHAISHLETKPEFKCSVAGCGRTYTSQQSLTKHEKSHSDPLPYKCPEEGCLQAFKKHSQLTIHRASHREGREGGDPRPFKCPHCPAAFLWPSILQKHLKSHRGYSCTKEGCLVQCATWSAMRKHRATHTSECEKCGRSFKLKSQLKAHVASMHSELRPLYSCEWEGCSNAYTTKFNLQQHVKSFHKGEKEHACSQEGCSSLFSTKQALKRHVEKVHEKPEPLKPKKAKKTRKEQLASKLSGYSKNFLSGSKKEGGGGGEEESEEAVLPATAACLAAEEEGSRTVGGCGENHACKVPQQTSQEPSQLHSTFWASSHAEGGRWTGSSSSTLPRPGPTTAMPV